MHKIDVIFMEDGVKVHTDPAVVNAGDEIMWHFVSTDPSIKWAEIQFDKGMNFFNARGGAKTNKRGTDVTNGHGYLLGSSPDIAGKGVRKDKYTVKGRRGSKSKVVKELDPDIITCDP